MARGEGWLKEEEEARERIALQWEVVAREWKGGAVSWHLTSGGPGLMVRGVKWEVMVVVIFSLLLMSLMLLLLLLLLGLGTVGGDGGGGAAKTFAMTRRRKEVERRVEKRNIAADR